MLNAQGCPGVFFRVCACSVQGTLLDDDKKHCRFKGLPQKTLTTLGPFFKNITGVYMDLALVMSTYN